MNDQTLRSLDDQALMDVVGGGGGCDNRCYQPCEPCGGLEIRIDVDVSLCL
jgi:hypothetical protein